MGSTSPAAPARKATVCFERYGRVLTTDGPSLDSLVREAEVESDAAGMMRVVLRKSMAGVKVDKPHAIQCSTVVAFRLQRACLQIIYSDCL